MRDDPGSSKIGPTTWAAIGLATCCGVKLALLASAGALTAGALGRSVALIGLGALVLVAALVAVARRRTTANAACPRGTHSGRGTPHVTSRLVDAEDEADESVGSPLNKGR
jgi:hypothetical protein